MNPYIFLFTEFATAMILAFAFWLIWNDTPDGNVDLFNKELIHWLVTIYVSAIVTATIISAKS